MPHFDLGSCPDHIETMPIIIMLFYEGYSNRQPLKCITLFLLRLIPEAEMASGYTGNQDNLCVILVKVGTPVAKAVFEKRVKDLTPIHHHPSPWTVDQFLEEKRTQIRQMKLHGQTWTKMFPEAKLEHWDLALICKLLLSFCDLQSDIALFIRQLQKLRNKFFHMSETSIESTKYKHYLSKLKVIFDRCLKDINDEDFTKEIEEMFEELEHGQYSQLDMDDVMKKLRSMEEETNDKLTELGRGMSIIGILNKHFYMILVKLVSYNLSKKKTK